jgi:hypothetical protein
MRNHDCLSLFLLTNSPLSEELPMCGVLSGGVGTWNQGLDGAFAFNTLIAGDAVQVVHITNPGQNLGLAEAFLSAAGYTSGSRASGRWTL